MFLYTLTWEDVSKLDRNVVIVIPFGAVEQHSYHLPLGTDSILVEEIARRFEATRPDHLLVVPVTWLGCSRHHMEFPGSLTAEIDTFIETGEQIVTSMAAHGFRKFILLNGHGGNIGKIAIMAEKLRYQPGPLLKVIGITYWHLISQEIQSIRETPMGGMNHACELETSMMLAAHPDLVRRDRIEADGPTQVSEFDEKDMFDPGVVSVTRTVKEISRHGGLGDPTKASAEKGERIFAALISKLNRILDDIQSDRL